MDEHEMIASELFKFTKEEYKAVEIIKNWLLSLFWPGIIITQHIEGQFWKYNKDYEHAWAFDEIDPITHRFLADKTDEEVREIGMEIRTRREAIEKTMSEFPKRIKYL